MRFFPNSNVNKMDKQTKNFLAQIGLENLNSHFEEHGITFDVLEIINKEELAELVPKIGNRVKIRKALSDHKDSQNNTKDIQETRRDDAMKLPENIEMNIKFETLEGDNVCSSSGIPQDVQQALSLFEEENIDEEALVDYGNERIQESLPLQISQPVTHEHFKKSFTFENNLSLEGYLQTSVRGRFLMRTYSINNCLTNSDRRSLTEIVVNGILNQQDHVRSPILEEMAQNIVDLFPTERKEVYFFKNTKSKNFKGKLVDKYRNLKKIRPKFCPGKNKHEDRKMIIPIVDSSLDHLQDSYTWLQNNSSPWEDVQHHWKRTFPLRCHHHRQNNSLGDFLEKWPILTDHHSFKLVEIDFELLYPGSSCQFEPNFKKYRAILHNKIDKSVLSDSCLDADGNNVDDWLIWSQLPRMISVARYFDGEKCVRPTKDIAAMNFIRYILDPSEMENICNTKRDLVKMSNNRLQHYCQIFSIASTRKHVLRFCDISYEFECVSRAVEVCVKLHKVCNVQYPPDSNSAYLLIQRLLFEIESHNDRVALSTSVFVGDVRQQAATLQQI